ncbi:PAS domain S-box protein [Nannocystaceae bacterium ST9]
MHLWHATPSKSSSMTTPTLPPASTSTGIADDTGVQVLLQSGALKNAILNSANFSILATDEAGVVRFFNVGAEQLLGYSAAEVVGVKQLVDLCDPNELIARARSLNNALDTSLAPSFEALIYKASRGIEDSYELTLVRKDGEPFPALVSVTALQDGEGTRLGYLIFGTDDSARKHFQAERDKLDQRLRDQQFYTRSLIEANIDGLMVTDLSGVITDVNKQLETLTGCTRDELIGAPLKNYFTDPERVVSALARVLSEMKIANFELAVRSRDGRETPISYNASTLYDRERKLQGVFSTARDITEFKRLGRMVEERAEIAKSDFLSNMSHELRSPLNAILGFAQLMQTESPPPTPAQQEGIEHIISAGWYLLELINEILDLATLESGKAPLSEEPIALSEVMLECQAMIEPMAQKRGITMHFPQVDRDLYVLADSTRLKQVFINLLSNAIKYNQSSGKVMVECAVRPSNRTRITISDTGAGLPPEKVAQLFQPFNRLGQEHSDEEGTGIGLVVSKRVVEMMGGVIGVASVVGVGTSFWFELSSAAAPRRPRMASGPVVESHSTSDARPQTVLCVEDNPANLKLIEGILARRANITLFSAGNGTLGVEIARAERPDVILMDLNLPGISGLQAMKIIQADPLTSHIPVLALSAYGLPRDVKAGLDAGFFRYITKPIKVDEFMLALDLAFECSRVAARRASS